MKKALVGLLSLVMVFSVFCLFNVKTVRANPLVTLKFQDVYPKTSDASLHLLFFVKKVREYSNGEVEIKV
ncbi:MAG: hypothetical protein JRC86_10635, partial [Deltaproteobacteria bacterium]|nr:hypothetical protein [Deltaproteobacteria bacterium]